VIFLTGLAGIIAKSNDPILEPLKRMLISINHRGSDQFEVFMGNEVSFSDKLEELAFFGLGSTIAIGSCWNFKNSSGYGQRLGDGYIVTDGNFDMDVKSQKKDLELPELLNGQILSSKHGFSTAGIYKKSIILARDLIGLKPLYFGENEKYKAFASEKKALWEIGIIEKVTPVLPGEVWLMDNSIIKIDCLRHSLDQKLESQNYHECLASLKEKLVDAVLTQVRNIDSSKAAVLFSGGLDSIIIAKILMMNNVEPRLYCSGFKGCRDFKTAEKAAEELGLTLEKVILTDQLVKRKLKKIVWHLESCDPITAEIATPFYFATQSASKAGFSHIFTGQGADELFAGYSRYEKTYQDSGNAGLKRVLDHDLFNIWHKNLERDNKICMANSVDLLIPYLSRHLVEFIMQIPTEYRLKRIGNGYIRKQILRDVGSELGIDEGLLNQKKTAVQYGSGTTKCFRRLSSDMGFDRDQVRLYGFSTANQLMLNVICINLGFPKKEIIKFSELGVLKRDHPELYNML
jgi:asparagine synthase (glutamine-hydrolysing)